MNYRHGDVNLHEVAEIPKGAKKIAHDGSFVLAHGEATGHKHVIRVPNIEDMEMWECPDGRWYITMKNQGTLTHEEHGTIVVAPRKYVHIQERELDLSSGLVRKVVD